MNPDETNYEAAEVKVAQPSAAQTMRAEAGWKVETAHAKLILSHLIDHLDDLERAGHRHRLDCAIEDVERIVHDLAGQVHRLRNAARALHL